MTVQFVKTEVIPFGVAPSSEPEALRMVEMCGRTAYKSEDKITEDSAKAFVLMLKKHGHLSVLEHSNAVLKAEIDHAGDPKAPDQGLSLSAAKLISTLKERNAYHRVQTVRGDGDGFVIAGNFRAWIETLQYLQKHNTAHYELLAQGLSRFYPSLFPLEKSLPDLEPTTALLTPEEQLEFLRSDPSSDLPVFVFKVICDRGITHEIVRHRVLSFTQESTRYVNYKNKGMTLILPEELDACYDAEKGELDPKDPLADKWLQRATSIFNWYQEDIGRGRRPEIARDILPNLLKSEIFVSGRWSGWRHFIRLRDSKQAHPRIRSISQQVKAYFESIGMRCE